MKSELQNSVKLDVSLVEPRWQTWTSASLDIKSNKMACILHTYALHWSFDE